MSSSGSRETRKEEIQDISSAVKQIAVDFKVAVIALSQLPRSVDYNKDQIARLLDVEMAIEKEADLVILLKGHSVIDNVTQDDKESLELAVAKNRHGAAGSVRLSL